MRDPGSRQRFLDALLALARVLRVEPATKITISPPSRQRLRDLGAGGAPGRDVVGADVGEPLRRRRVGVVRDQERALGDLVEQRRHVGGIDRRDRDAVDAAREQVLEDLLLLVDRAGLRHAEVDRDAELGLRLAYAGFGDGPEARWSVDDEGVALATARARRRRGAVTVTRGGLGSGAAVGSAAGEHAGEHGTRRRARAFASRATLSHTERGQASCGRGAYHALRSHSLGAEDGACGELGESGRGAGNEEPRRSAPRAVARTTAGRDRARR